MTIHYHGTPVTPRERLYECAGRHFCVSFAEPRDAAVCHEIGQSVLLDNGAYTFWTQGRAPDWDAYHGWAERWLAWPTTWAIIPDVIDGGEDENDALIDWWAGRGLPRGAPVWHLHEPLDRLRRLAGRADRVCFGSSGEYRQLGTPSWHRRMSEAFDAIADPAGRVPWVHMLRGMAQTGGPYPFASVDSANAARNAAGSWRARPRPVDAMMADHDAVQCPAVWDRAASAANQMPLASVPSGGGVSCNPPAA